MQTSIADNGVPGMAAESNSAGGSRSHFGPQGAGWQGGRRAQGGVKGGGCVSITRAAGGSGIVRRSAGKRWNPAAASGSACGMSRGRPFGRFGDIADEQRQSNCPRCRARARTTRAAAKRVRARHWQRTGRPCCAEMKRLGRARAGGRRAFCNWWCACRNWRARGARVQDTSARNGDRGRGSRSANTPGLVDGGLEKVCRCRGSAGCWRGIVCCCVQWREPGPMLVVFEHGYLCATQAQINLPGAPWRPVQLAAKGPIPLLQQSLRPPSCPLPAAFSRRRSSSRHSHPQTRPFSSRASAVYFCRLSNAPARGSQTPPVPIERGPQSWPTGEKARLLQGAHA